MSCSSSVEPLQLIWSNNTVSGDGKAASNGIFMFLGNPSQPLSLRPTFSVNNTLINNIATCGSQSNTSCISTIGGGFNPESSSTYRVSSLTGFNGSQEGLSNTYLYNAPYVYVNDLFSVPSGMQFPGFPLVMETNILQYAALGLGTNSTFMSALVNANLVPSRSLSLYTGAYSAVKAGAVVLGGYSNQFYQGQLYTEKANPTFCTACFNITGMNWNDSNGTLDLMSTRTRKWFTGEVDPYQPFLVLPQDVFNALGTHTGASVDTNYGLLSYLASNVPSGNLTVTLSNGLETTIPNYALFDPPALDGGILQYGRNTSLVYGLFESLAYTSQDDSYAEIEAILGLPYSAWVYIIRDFERNNVSIATAANVTAQNFPSRYTPICSITDKRSTLSHHRSNAGAIAGGVIGGIALLALICLAVWWFFLRKRKSKKTGAVDPLEAPLHAEHKSQEEGLTTAKSTSSPSSELPPETRAIWEIKSNNIYEAPTRLATHELPTGPRLRSELPT